MKPVDNYSVSQAILLIKDALDMQKRDREKRERKREREEERRS